MAQTRITDLPAHAEPVRFAPGFGQRFIGGGFDLIVAGLVAGTLAFLIGRKRKSA